MGVKPYSEQLLVVLLSSSWEGKTLNYRTELTHLLIHYFSNRNASKQFASELKLKEWKVHYIFFRAPCH